MKLSVIMPVFNEVSTIEMILERVQKVSVVSEVILVDDGSSDGTSQLIDRLAAHNVKVLHHPRNMGKGVVVKKGVEAASGDLVVIQDADLEYDPNDFIQLITAIEKDGIEIVYGVRSLQSQRRIMRWGNYFITWVTNLLYGQKLQDMETCYKMMKRQVLLGLDLECRRFDVEAEITSKLIRSGFRIHEVPVSYQARYQNKKLSPLDGLPAIRALLKYRNWQPRMKADKSGDEIHANSKNK